MMMIMIVTVSITTARVVIMICTVMDCCEYKNECNNETDSDSDSDDNWI